LEPVTSLTPSRKTKSPDLRREHVFGGFEIKARYYRYSRHPEGRAAARHLEGWPRVLVCGDFGALDPGYEGSKSIVHDIVNVYLSTLLKPRLS
jgi:hypothetical protein